jgi:SAM-dependent methyltransferase
MIQFLSPEQLSEIQERYQVAEYQLRALDRLNTVYNLQGKRVLEIGGSNLPRSLIFGNLKCEKWVSVDIIDPNHYALTQQAKHYQVEQIYNLADSPKYFDGDPYVIFNGFAEKITPIFYDQFDAIFSIASFEHVGKLTTVLSRIHSSLKPGGVMYSRFSPIWSCHVGHHCWVRANLNFNNLGAIPEFGHLLMRPFEMFEHLRGFYKPEICEEVVHQMYFSDRINRLFYEDYEAAMSFSPFERYSCHPTGINAVSSQILDQLKTLHPGRTRFDAYGLEIVAYK